MATSLQEAMQTALPVSLHQQEIITDFRAAAHKITGQATSQKFYLSPKDRARFVPQSQRNQALTQ